MFNTNRLLFFGKKYNVWYGNYANERAHKHHVTEKIKSIMVKELPINTTDPRRPVTHSGNAIRIICSSTAP